jgi:hypothetical protein
MPFDVDAQSMYFPPNQNVNRIAVVCYQTDSSITAMRRLSWTWLPPFREGYDWSYGEEKVAIESEATMIGHQNKSKPLRRYISRNIYNIKFS